MALKKTDLYSSLWASCDQLRGGMDATEYKDYILTLLFVKYVSDKFSSDPDAIFEVPVGGSFNDMLLAKGDKEIGDRFNKVIAKLAEANDLQNVIDQADFNDEEKLGKGKEMQDRLSKLVTIFNDLDFHGSKADGDDLLGDAYEYLMRHFATESGKSKGQFYTPAEVSRILAQVVGINEETRQDHTVYDPTCGSGSLLLKAAAQAPRGMTIYGQEKDNATWALSKMNMILHGNETAEIKKGDTITSPGFVKSGNLQTFDYVVMNPPFSVKAWNNGLESDYGLFEYGVPPDKNGDFAFLLHGLKSLNSTGKAAIILPHGVLFRGNAESGIRTRLLKHGFIKGIIGLPANLFYGTGIPACIIVLDKENSQARTGVFMVDASKGFVKDGNKNRMRSKDIHRVVDVFTNQREIDGYSRMVPMREVADPRNNYNLNIPRYIDSSEPEDLQDLSAHIHGGIPDRDLDMLQKFWSAFPELRSQIFTPNRPGYSDLTIDVSEVQQTILDSRSFQRLRSEATDLVNAWCASHYGLLTGITSEVIPNELIAIISDDFLARFEPFPLLDEYDAYEQLMTYWHDTMQDDVYLIAANGWASAAKPRPAINDKERKLTEEPDLVVGSGKNTRKYKMDLIPPTLVMARYFAVEHRRVLELKDRAEEASGAVSEYLEEHASEDGLLVDAMAGDTITKKLVNTRLNAVNGDGDPNEIKALQNIIELYKEEETAKNDLKVARSELELSILEKYAELTDKEIKSLVVGDKWRCSIKLRIFSEFESLTLELVGRIQQLGDRYAVTVRDLYADLDRLEAKVEQHLADMGVE